MKEIQTRWTVRLATISSLAVGCVILLGGGLTAMADDATAVEKKPEEKKKKWESFATAGLTLTRGNSQNFLANAAIGTKRTWTSDELLLGASGGYGDTTTRQSDGTK